MGKSAAMSKPPTPDYPTKLKIRTYDCRLTARRVKLGLEKLMGSSLAFNESWLLGAFDIGSRISGLGQYGDIIIRHRTVMRGKHELTIEHRAGDEALTLEIEAMFTKDLTPKGPRLAPGKKRPEGMAYFFEMIRISSLRKSVLIADAVLEEAHDLSFDDYREARAKLEFLSMFPRLGVMKSTWDSQILQAYAEAKVRHPKPKVCLFEGQKVALPHRMVAISAKHDYNLTLHFAKLPGLRVLVGWVEENEA